MLTQLIVTSAASSTWLPGVARQIALAKPPQFHIKNSLQLRGFLGKDAEVPSSDGITDDAFAVLTLCVESGVWWRPSNEWLSKTAWFRVICPGPFFCGFTRGMKQGEYIEVDGQLAIHHYRSLNFTNPVYEIHATQIRRLEIPVVGVIEKYDG